MQAGGEGIRGPQVVLQGGSIVVEVGPNDTTVEVDAGTKPVTSHPVQPGKTATIPVPPVTPGTILAVTVGKGLRARMILVEVVAK